MSQLIVALLVIAFTGFAVGVYRRMSLWRQGQAAAFSWMLLAQIPKRYLVDLHHIVARDKYIANTHVAAAGGVVGSVVMLVLIYFLGFKNSLTYGVLWGLLVLGLIGAFFVYKRRMNPPERLSKGLWSAVPYSLFGFGLGFLGLTVAEANASRALWPHRYGAGRDRCSRNAGGVMLSRPLYLCRLDLCTGLSPRQSRFDSVTICRRIAPHGS